MGKDATAASNKAELFFQWLEKWQKKVRNRKIIIFSATVSLTTHQPLPQLIFVAIGMCILVQSLFTIHSDSIFDFFFTSHAFRRSKTTTVATQPNRTYNSNNKQQTIENVQSFCLIVYRPLYKHWFHVKHIYELKKKSCEMKTECIRKKREKKWTIKMKSVGHTHIVNT